VPLVFDIFRLYNFFYSLISRGKYNKVNETQLENIKITYLKCKNNDNNNNNNIHNNNNNIVNNLSYRDNPSQST
jgi:hypothetical protein